MIIAYRNIIQDIKNKTKDLEFYRSQLNDAIKGRNLERAIQLMQQVKEKEAYIAGLESARDTLQAFCYDELGLAE